MEAWKINEVAGYKLQVTGYRLNPFHLATYDLRKEGLGTEVPKTVGGWRRKHFGLRTEMEKRGRMEDWNNEKAVGVGDSRPKTGRMDGLYLVK